MAAASWAAGEQPSLRGSGTQAPTPLWWSRALSATLWRSRVGVRELPEGLKGFGLVLAGQASLPGRCSTAQGLFLRLKGPGSQASGIRVGPPWPAASPGNSPRPAPRLPSGTPARSGRFCSHPDPSRSASLHTCQRAQSRSWLPPITHTAPAHTAEVGKRPLAREAGVPVSTQRARAALPLCTCLCHSGKSA